MQLKDIEHDVNEIIIILRYSVLICPNSGEFEKLNLKVITEKGNGRSRSDRHRVGACLFFTENLEKSFEGR